MKYKSSLFSKKGLFERYGENPGSMLVHTGVLGWILSSAAQVSAIIFNDKISPEQKSFLIPQEIADGAVNIASFYIVTSSFKRLASKLVKTGKLTTNGIKKSLLEQGIDKSKIGKLDFDIGKLENVPEGYKPFKNGVDVIASTIGSILSCNIITPVIRNQYASKRQKEIVAKMNNNKTEIKTPRLSIDAYQKMASVKFSGSTLKI